ncbi:MAG TPA: hypothetical protein PKL15_12510 [Saprospiraceae bacterium]|nr:hypothetical protein [Saprospiraceae bacterium]
MSTEQSVKIRQQIAAHRLFPKLMERMQQVRIGGVQRSTIYKAFSEGGVTPTCQLILDTAQALIEEHKNTALQAA